MTYDIPDWIPEHLRPYYSPPTVDDHPFFAQRDVSRYLHYDRAGHGIGVPESVRVYENADWWAVAEVNKDPRWSDYLAFIAEKPPWKSGTPQWLADAPISDLARGVVMAALEQDYERRHAPTRPHHDTDLYRAAVWKRTMETTEEEMRRLWDDHHGIPRAQAALEEAEQAERDRLQSERRAQDQARQAATKAREDEHAQITEQALARLDATADQLHSKALERITRSGSAPTGATT